MRLFFLDKVLIIFLIKIYFLYKKTIEKRRLKKQLDSVEGILNKQLNFQVKFKYFLEQQKQKHHFSDKKYFVGLKKSGRNGQIFS